MNGEAGTPPRPRRRRAGRRALIGVLGVLSLILTACSTQDVAATRTCGNITTGGKIVAVSSRGAIGLAKIGLAPRVLKAQEKCE
jgi:hypothetical protein